LRSTDDQAKAVIQDWQGCTESGTKVLLEECRRGSVGDWRPYFSKTSLKAPTSPWKSIVLTNLPHLSAI